MNTTLKTIYSFILFSLVLAVPPDSHAQLRIDLEGPIVEKVSIVVPGIVPASGSMGDSKAQEFSEVVRNDLKNSALFKVHTASVGKKNLDFQALFEAGEDAIVTGEYQSKPDRLVIAVRLFDVSREKMLVGRSYEVSPSRIREAAHRFANLIIKELTGINGYFSSKIVYVSGVGRKRDLYMIDYDGKNSRRLTNHNALVMSPHCSRNGSKIAFNSDKVWDQDIYVLDLIPRVSERRIAKRLRLEQSAEWSPNGRQVAYSSNMDIYVANFDGANPRNLTRSRAIEISPTWSPDGSQIAFVSDKTGSPKIYVMNSNGSGLRLITPKGYNTDPSWSTNPGVNKIAFVRIENSQANLFTINPDGSGEQRLTWSAGRNENPSWSPDGHYIAFSSTRDGAKDLYLMYLNGDNQTRLTSGGSKSFPTWCR